MCLTGVVFAAGSLVVLDEPESLPQPPTTHATATTAQQSRRRIPRFPPIRRHPSKRAGRTYLTAQAKCAGSDTALTRPRRRRVRERALSGSGPAPTAARRLRRRRG